MLELKGAGRVDADGTRALDPASLSAPQFRSAA